MDITGTRGTNSDRTRWSGPIRAQLAVQELERKLGTTTRQPPAHSADRVDVIYYEIEPPD
jgi:hypothetical protein